MENRSNNAKTQSSNQTNNQSSNQTNNRSANTRSSNSASDEHKHPNQYTKGADDEGANNAKSTNKSSKNCR